MLRAKAAILSSVVISVCRVVIKKFVRRLSLSWLHRRRDSRREAENSRTQELEDPYVQSEQLLAVGILVEFLANETKGTKPKEW